MKNELKRCPFCGGLAFAKGTHLVWVECYTCNARTEAKPDRTEAIEVWNRRTDEEEEEI